MATDPMNKSNTAISTAAPKKGDKAHSFRTLLSSSRLEFICEAHNGLSAKIVEEAGFKGIWASGLAISAQLGVRDNNEASWTQVLDVIEFMSDASSLPIMLDGDTGYGNFNNVQRLVRKLEQRDIAAVCLEDKLFPKTNSFIGGNRQPLANIDEFCGKIKAGKDAQSDDNFCIVARIEAFIAGWGLEEALRRAEAYHAAGADAVLIHSALRTPDEIFSFTNAWGNRCPVVVVPTTYYSTPTDVFREHGISMAIWANQMLRTSVQAMQKTCSTLFSTETLMSVEDGIAPVREIFRLQGAAALQEAEERYLPKSHQAYQAIVLSAARGEELGTLTSALPKTMLPIAGKPILSHIVAAFNATGINRIHVVRGFCKEAVNLPGLLYVDNPQYADNGELYSFFLALESLSPHSSVIVSYGDVLFKKYIVELLRDAEAPIAVAIDINWQESVNRNRIADYAHCSQAYSRASYGQKVSLVEIDPEMPHSSIHGEWMGFIKFDATVMPDIRRLTMEILDGDSNAKLPTLLHAIVGRGTTVQAIYTTGNWLDVDSIEDLFHANGF
jgi:phosphoenolpyruvate phosphomutase